MSARWDFTRDANSPPWAMDVRHIAMISAVVRLSGCQRAVEIGALKGRSTTAFVEAVERGAPLEWLGVCDMNPEPSVSEVLAQMPSRVQTELFAGKSDRITWNADLWVIDGNHEFDFVVADYALARNSGAKVIILHDTNHHAVDGPARVLRMAAHHFPVIFHDFKQREGEETERGIAFLFAPSVPTECVNVLDFLSR